MNQFENNFNDGAYKWDAFNSHASVPTRPTYTEPRFKHHDFKTCINGTLKLQGFHVDVYVHTGQNSTVIPSNDNMHIYIYTENRFGRDFIREDDEDSGLREGTYQLYADMQKAVLQEIERRVMDNQEYLDDLREF